MIIIVISLVVEEHLRLLRACWKCMAWYQKSLSLL